MRFACCWHPLLLTSAASFAVVGQHEWPSSFLRLAAVVLFHTPASSGHPQAFGLYQAVGGTLPFHHLTYLGNKNLHSFVGRLSSILHYGALQTLRICEANDGLQSELSFQRSQESQDSGSLAKWRRDRSRPQRLQGRRWPLQQECYGTPS